LGPRVLRSSSQGERKTDLKKASWTAANNSGKRNLAVMQEGDKPYSSDGSPGPQRKVARVVGAIDAGIQVEPDIRDGEHNLSWQLADRTSQTNSPSPFTPNPGHHHGYAACEQAEARRSAAHLFVEFHRRSLRTHVYFVVIPFLSFLLLSISSFVSHYQSRRRGEYTWFVY